MVYHGPNNGEGFTVYYHGVEVGHEHTRYNRSYITDPDFMFIGRRWTDMDNLYTSVCMDELTMWNRQLSVQQIQDIFNIY